MNVNKKNITLIIGIALLSIIILMLVVSYALPESVFSFDIEKFLQENKITLNSDYSTVDSYKEYFASGNTKNNGKVWTDKSVYNYQQTKGNVALDKNLTYLNGGQGFNVNYQDDFLHVFSALGSSQSIKSQNVLDFLIVIDMSGSMGSDVVDNLEHKDEKTRIEHSRIQVTINSVNNAIDEIMKQNDKNRVSVVVYAATAYTLLELGHYEKLSGYNTYITVENFTSYEEKKFDPSGSAAYTLRVKALKDGKDIIERSVRNNYTANMTKEKIQQVDECIGYNTNLQSGIYLGFDELYSKIESDIIRNPVAIIMTDGGSNFGLKRDDKNPNIGDEWYNVQLQKSVNKYDVNYQMYRAEDNKMGTGGKEIIFETLLTASFMKSKVEKRYEELLKNSDKYNGPIDFQIHTVSVDTPTEEWAIPRVYTTLNPKDYFKEELSNVDWKFKNDSTDAYQLFKDWQSSTDGIVSKFIDSTDKNITLKINKLPNTVDGVTNEDVVANIKYNDSFKDIKSEDLTDYFNNIIVTISELFNPLVDTQDESKVKSALSYVDKIGDYMELKEVKTMLLFGKEYNIIKDGELQTENVNNQKISQQYYKAVGSNGGDLTIKNNSYISPVSFKLSDIKIWVNIDSNGNQTFNITIPSAALPIRVSEVTIDNNNNVLDLQENTNTIDSMPIRFIYTVGLKDEIIDEFSKIKLKNISQKYITDNSKIINGKEYLIFNSNYYTKNNLYGDANVTITPSKDNLYYYNNSNLPIYEKSDGGDGNGEGELTTTGGKVVLSNNLTKLSDIDKNKVYYYVSEYYTTTENGFKKIDYATAIKGSEFYDEKGNIQLVYYDINLKKETDTFGDNIIVATKVGSNRVNTSKMLASKKENITDTSKYVSMLKEKSNDSMIYYLGNNGELEVPLNGELEIRKEVLGTDGDKNKEWVFSIKLIPKNGVVLDSSYSYTGGSFVNGIESAEDGILNLTKQSDGSYIGSISLKHGQSIVIKELAIGTTYQISENNANTDNYKLVATGENGEINISQRAMANFENTKGFSLPKTGGIESILPIIIGTIFIIWGVITFIFLSKRKKTNNN